MKQTPKIAFAYLSLLLLAGCGSSNPTPSPTPSLSFEELQSQYMQKVGAAGCTAFMVGDYENAARWFRIIEQVVPEWEGYADGVLREGKSFDAGLCY